MSVRFVASGRDKVQYPSDPAYPDGIVLMPDIADDAPRCRFDLWPYPAPECGWFHVKCETCGITIMVAAAGRPDDFAAVVMPCLTRTARVN